MKTKTLCCFIAITGAFMASCNSAPEKGDGSITMEDRNGQLMTVCDIASVQDTITLPLSDLVEDCKLIRFENTDTALFKFSGIAITDKHIAIRNSGGAVKLFNHDGKFLCDVGNYGQGPGEYQFLYDALIDEKGKCIYLAPFHGYTKILKYDMNGRYLDAIDFGEELNKPKLALEPDGTLSLVHLCFKGMSEFMAAHVAADGTITKYIPAENMKTETRDNKGYFVGFNNEIWSYRNVPGLTFMAMPVDTLYRYNAKKNELEPRFALQKSGSGEKPFCIYNELPNYYFGILWGIGTILVDKKKNTSHYLRITNDYFGNMEAPLNFQDGWFFAMYEPGALVDKIETTLSKGGLSDQDREKLNSLLSSIDENDNNLLFVGKLKK